MTAAIPRAKIHQPRAQAIQAALTPGEVLSAVHRFLSSLTPAEVSCLPPGLLAFASGQVQELSHVAVELAQREILASSSGLNAGLLKDAGFDVREVATLSHGYSTPHVLFVAE